MHTRVLAVSPAAIKYPPHDPTTQTPIIDPNSDTYANLQEAVAVIKSSSSSSSSNTTNTQPLVAFPTETVYGLGADARNDNAVRAIYAAKNRPADNPLIVHVSSLAQLERISGGPLPEIYVPIVKAFWPGPLTIVLPVPTTSQNSVSPLCTHGQKTFAVRMPNHPVARALIALSDTPLAAPSANLSTRPSPTSASHVYADLHDRIPLILDGGPCDVGVESTVVDGTVSPPKLLRPGGISVEQIRQQGGPLWQSIVVGSPDTSPEQVPRTPGMKYKHYSPSCPVYLFIDCPDGAQAVRETLLTQNNQNQNQDQDQNKNQNQIKLPQGKIAILTTYHFDPKAIEQTLAPTETVSRSLGVTGADISRNLFSELRHLEKTSGAAAIIVEGVPLANEGLAIMNRLTKAASHIFRKVGSQYIIEK
ncbi:uncharacterized protein SAPINGB_P000956 [Magnusiomyces paraingens]|uniref:Threonylcarbamoyl-AMP synthase n=1 Tax=Magnusiomyces paraingens TaxID=2606893 RepID=A0A5E8B9F7_9ASCO|nr:uncharacterized protein SAPINGB_P000956 [Saprochaete ingens]VVT45918.1 unnamed protein product [Saprochaete ingens]